MPEAASPDAAQLTAALRLLLQKHERAVLFRLRTPVDDAKYEVGLRHHHVNVEGALGEVVELILNKG